MNDVEEVDHHSKERVAALTDGIYSVAMTLLVIDLKLPDALELRNSRGLTQALVALEPKFTTWATSFFVLALFYMGNLRSMRTVRALDGPLVILYLTQLALVSLVPFSTALVGQYRPVAPSQVIYSLNMAALAVLSLAISHHIALRPALQRVPVVAAAALAGRIRTLGVLAISVAAVPISMIWPGSGQAVFLLMLLVIPVSKRFERTR